MAVLDAADYAATEMLFYDMILWSSVRSDLHRCYSGQANYLSRIMT